MADLIKEWLQARAEWVAANEANRPVSQRNRIMDRIRLLANRIAAQSELREEIAAMCASDREADLRLDAALVREHWDSSGAADTLVSIVRDSGAAIERPVTMSGALRVNTTSVAATAALCLMNIDQGRGNTATPA